MSRTARLALHTASNSLRLLVSVGVWTVVTPAMLRSLGAEDYGLWQLAGSVLGFFQLLDVGFGVGVVQTVGRAAGTGDTARRNRMLSTFLMAYLVLAAVAALALASFAPVFPSLFHLPADRASDGRLLLVVLGLRVVVLALPLSLYRSVLIGSQRLGSANLVQIVSQLAYGVLTLTSLRMGGGVAWLAFISLATMLVEHAAYAFLAFRSVRDLRVSPRLAEFRMLRGTIRLSAAQLVIAVSGLVLLRTDPIVVQLFVGLQAVAIYTIVLRIAEQAFLGVKQFINALAPIVAELDGKGDGRGQRLILVSGTKAALVPATLIVGASISLGHFLLQFWVGPDVAAAAPVLTVLLVAMALMVPQTVVFSLFTYSGRHGLPGRAAAAGALVNLAATMALARPFGLLGVALGTLTATVVVDLLWVVRAGCRAHGVPMRDYLATAILPVLVPFAAQAGATWILVHARPPASLAETVTYALPGVGLYLGLLWTLGLNADERGRIARHLPWLRLPMTLARGAAA